MALRLSGPQIAAFALLTALPGVLGHPCEAEVSSACPDTPASDVAACLKDPSQHEQVTDISDECTDFIALNVACGADIDKFCDEALFSEDTTVCLTQWTEPGDLSGKCRGVLAWAVPAADVDGDEEGPTDELGMSEKDKEEKREWQAQRRAARGDAIERMKMKEADRKKEQERLSLEQFKADDPEGYKEMIRQQEEEKRQVAEQKRRERQMQAAMERRKEEEEKARRREAGEDVDGEKSKPKVKKASKNSGEKANGKQGTSTMTALLCFVAIAAACVGGILLVQKVSSDADDDKARKGKAPKKKKA